MNELNEGIITSEKYCDQFDNKYNYWMRAEYLGKYFYARNNKEVIVMDKGQNSTNINWYITT